MVAVSRDTPRTSVGGIAFVNALAGLVGSILQVIQPFTILAFWQLCLGLFVYFFPVAAEQWEHATGMSWPLLGVICAFIRMGGNELRK